MKILPYSIQLLVKAFFNPWNKVTLHGLENLPEKSNFLLASNHISYLDPVLIIAFLYKYRKISPIATQGLFKFPLSTLLNAGQSIAVDRAAKYQRNFMETVVSALEDRPLLIFPEGGVKRYEKKCSIPSGIGYIMKNTGTTVIPLKIIGTDKAMKKRTYIIKRVPVSIHIGPVLKLDSKEDMSYKEISRYVMETIDAIV